MPPANNRTPEESEADACLPYLRVQFALIRPKIIVCLGATAAKYIYDPNVRITRDRGVWKEKKGSVDTAYISSCRAAERRIQEAGGMGGYAKVKAKIR